MLAEKIKVHIFDLWSLHLHACTAHQFVQWKEKLFVYILPIILCTMNQFEGYKSMLNFIKLQSNCNEHELAYQVMHAQ